MEEEGPREAWHSSGQFLEVSSLRLPPGVEWIASMDHQVLPKLPSLESGPWGRAPLVSQGKVCPRGQEHRL